MTIDQKQIFWKMKYCYAIIPIVQILDGRTNNATFRYYYSNKTAGRIF